jgi:flavin-dependent dehydrogenase
VRIGAELVDAGTVVLATGKHDLRARPRPNRSSYIGLKLHLLLDPASLRRLRRCVEIVLFTGGYAGLQLVEGAVANLCLVVTKERFAVLGRDWRRLVEGVPHLKARLEGARACWARPLAVAGIPYGHLHAGPAGMEPAVYRVGDQAAVIPSFTGDGMAMALRSAAAAAAAILAGEPADAYHDRLARAFRPPMRLAGAVARLNAIPPLQAPLVSLCRLLPGLLPAVAAATRAGR